MSFNMNSILNNYKNISLLIILHFALLSCTSKIENRRQESEREKISIICEKGTEITKTTLNDLVTTWIANSDKIGVYSPQSRESVSGPEGVNNIAMTATSSAQYSSFSGNIYWGTQPSSFYAYYPYKSGLFNYTEVPITIPAVQTQTTGNNSNHISILDFMISKPISGLIPAVDGNPVNVSLKFNHLYSLLEFQIINSSSTVSISKIILKGNSMLAFDSGTINISQQYPGDTIPYILNNLTSISNDVILNITTPFNTTNGYLTTPKAYMMVNPGIHAGSVKIRMEINGVIKEVVKTGVEFKRGKKYLVRIDSQSAYIPAFSMDDLPQVTIGNVIWSPVNCGYDATHKYGLMYQWGRKFGQGINLTEQPTKITESSVSKTLSVVNLPENSHKFYLFINGYTSYGTSETIWRAENNPCPTGWRVPTTTDFDNLKAYGYTLQLSGGPDNVPGIWVGPNHSNSELRKSTALFFPLTGYNEYTSGIGQMRGTSGSGHYWAASKHKYYFTTAMNLTQYPANGEYYLYGNAVRCVKDK